MKKKTNVRILDILTNKFVIIILLIVVLILVVFSFIMILDEPHFKITKNGEEVDRIDNYGIPNQSFFFDISKQDLTTDWLDENCECGEQTCNFHFNYSKRVKITSENAKEFVSVTYEGPIWFFTDESGHKIAEFYQKDTEIVEECNPCQEYKCEFDETYFVEIWNQIK